MTPSGTVLLVAGTYLLACLWVGMRAGRGTSDSAVGFVAGDRSLGPVVMYFITGATIFSAFAFLGAPGWAYSRGVAALYVLAYGTLGFVPFYFLGPRAARVGKAYGFVTQAEMVAHRFRSPALAGVMALVSVAALVPYVALQVRGAGLIVESMTRGAVPEELGGAVVYGIVLLYVLKSGVLGVGWTNTLQGVLMIALAWGLGLYLPWKLYGGVGEMFRTIAAERPELLQPPGLAGPGNPWSWGEYSTAVLMSMIGFSFWPHLFMKAFTARDERTLRRTVVLYPTFQVFLIPVFLMGFAAVLHVREVRTADQVLPHLMMSLELSPLVVGLFCAGGLAASMSSGDALIHAASSIAVRDGLGTALGIRLDPHAERRAIRIGIVLVAVAGYAFAVLSEASLVETLLHYAYGPVGQLAPVVVAALCWRRASAAGVLAGLVTGGALTLLLLARPELRPWAIHAGAYGLAANVLVLLAVSLARPQRVGAEVVDVAAGAPAGPA